MWKYFTGLSVRKYETRLEYVFIITHYNTSTTFFLSAETLWYTEAAHWLKTRTICWQKNKSVNWTASAQLGAIMDFEVHKYTFGHISSKEYWIWKVKFKCILTFLHSSYSRTKVIHIWSNGGIIPVFCLSRLEFTDWQRCSSMQSYNVRLCY